MTKPDADLTSPRARVSLLASHEHLREKRRCLAGVQAIKSRFFSIYLPEIPIQYLYILSYSSITWGVLRCLLGFLALWGQKPCGGNKLVLYSVLFRFGHIRRSDQCPVYILYSKISTDPGLLKIRHSHRFVAVVIQFLIPKKFVCFFCFLGRGWGKDLLIN